MIPNNDLNSQQKKKKRIRVVEGSCWQCKDKRVKCSLIKPICTRCSNLNINCDYSKIRLKWGKTNSDNNKTINRSNNGITKNKVAKNKKNSIDLSINTPDINIPIPSNSSIDSQIMIISNENNQLVKPQQEQQQQQYDDEDDELNSIEEINQIYIPKKISHIDSPDHQLLYFHKIIAPRLNALGHTFEVDLNLLCSNPLLNGLIRALSYSHLNVKLDSNFNIIEKSSINRINAIKLFSNSLRKKNENQLSIEILFTSCVLLCILDGIIEPKISISKNLKNSSPSLTINHLHGGRLILNEILIKNQLKNNSAANDTTNNNMENIFDNFDLSNMSDMYIVMLSTFGTMDLTCCLLTGESPFFDPKFWYKFSNKNCWWGNVSEDDSFLEILEILTSLAKIGSNYKKKKILMNSTTNEKHHNNCDKNFEFSMDSLFIYFERIQNLRNEILKNYHLKSEWERFTSTFIDVALLYLYRVLWNVQLTSNLIKDVVDQYIEKVSMGLQDDLQHCTLFPNLIIGAHLINYIDDTNVNKDNEGNDNFKSKRKIIEKILTNSYHYLAFNNIDSLLNCLHNIWGKTEKIDKNYNLDWFEMFHDIGERTFIF
ncbi:hypothetical protein B5S33_g4254 [[Candida] boidinii]|nr:hypothetical protein B5S33_g4254 [[Candida] boidinii]